MIEHFEHFICIMAVSGILVALQLFCLFKLLSTPSRRVPCYSDEIDAQLIFYGTFSSPRPFFGQEILARLLLWIFKRRTQVLNITRKASP